MGWIKVTNLDGGVVHINADQIVRLRPAGDAGAKTTIDLVAGLQGVRETPDEVRRRIDAAQRPGVA
jgi:uncharacterized protein YlzI (FlbEa/FlbD family)